MKRRRSTDVLLLFIIIFTSLKLVLTVITTTAERSINIGYVPILATEINNLWLTYTNSCGYCSLPAPVVSQSSYAVLLASKSLRIKVGNNSDFCFVCLVFFCAIIQAWGEVFTILFYYWLLRGQCFDLRLRLLHVRWSSGCATAWSTAVR